MIFFEYIFLYAKHIPSLNEPRNGTKWTPIIVLLQSRLARISHVQTVNDVNYKKAIESSNYSNFSTSLLVPFDGIKSVKERHRCR